MTTSWILGTPSAFGTRCKANPTPTSTTTQNLGVVDNCGGEPLRLADSFELPSGAANIGGEVALCAGDGYLGEGRGVLAAARRWEPW